MTRLAVMTVFLPRENLFFLEEWLYYHLAIGVGHFFLYDNHGSRWLDCGNSIEVTAKNKRGEEVYRILADRDDSTIERDLHRLLAPFMAKNLVTLVPWQPLDRAGRITYDQAGAFLDYVRRFSARSQWTCFTDLDEFVVPVRHDSVSEALDELERQGTTFFVLAQKCFASRFDAEGKPARSVLAITRCSDWVTDAFGRKALVRSDILKVPWFRRNYSIHIPATYRRKTKRRRDPELLRFNHYKYNQWEIDWVAANVGRPLRLDHVDDGMSRFSSRVEAVAGELGGIGR
jgi:hypothetical protein